MKQVTFKLKKLPELLGPTNIQLMATGGFHNLIKLLPLIHNSDKIWSQV